MSSTRYGHVPSGSYDSAQLVDSPVYLESPTSASLPRTRSTPKSIYKRLASSETSSLKSRGSLLFHPRGKTPAGFFDKWITNWWLWEICCAAFGTTLMIVLVVLLMKYDGKQTPHLGSLFGASITLNAIVSILATFSKGSLLYTVAECLGQLKWIWYSKQYKRMHELETFDLASRGAFGGFLLAWHVKFQQIATVGAVLMIIAVFMDPLAQQLVVYEPREHVVNSTDAYLPAQTRWEEAQTDARTISNTKKLDYISPSTKGALQIGINQGIELLDNVLPLCKPGNCTWFPYQTLGVCPSWTDVSDHLGFSNLTKEYFSRAEFWNLTNDHKIINDASTRYFNLSSVAPNNLTDTDKYAPGPLDFGQSIAYKDAKYPIADVFMVYYNGTTSTDGKPAYSAVEFLLEWCVKTFQTTTVNGHTSTVLLGEQRGFQAPHDLDSGNDDANPQYKPSEANSPTYSIDINTHYSLQRYLFWFFSGRIFSNGTWAIQKQEWIWYVDNDVVQTMFEPFNVFQRQLASETSGQGKNLTGFNQTLQNVAISLTNHIRKTSPDLSVYGQTRQYTIVVAVRWGWFAAPITFTVLSLAFLATTIIYQAAGVTAGGSWKTSSLAILHAANPDLQNILEGMKQTSEMNSQAKMAQVQLVNESEGGWRLWARRQPAGKR